MTADLAERDIEQLRLQGESLLRAPGHDPAPLLTLAGELQQQNEYGLARRLLLAAAAMPGAASTALTLRIALCTYHDEQLPPKQRFETALALLDSIGLRDPQCTDSDVLRQGGAVYKHMWETEGQIEFLAMALNFYRAGWERNPAQDLGCCAINAAFVYDVLGNRARLLGARIGNPTLQAAQYAVQARGLREDVLSRLPGLAGEGPQPYRVAITMGEAAWGVQRWDLAAHWFGQARQCQPDEHDLRASVRQLVSMAHFQGVSLDEQNGDQVAPEARRAIEILIGGSAEPVLAGQRGKVGLALSGGGFRASLYHLGVLARLAECDALRSVEVISTVSGGSIVGAQYYLALREMLESRPDQQLGAADYLDLVQQLIPHFLQGVQKNIRVRTFANVWRNVRMFGPGYTRSNRIGELFDRYLFSRVGVNGRAIEGRTMEQLKILPADSKASAAASFHPRYDNWRRVNKVPILLINSTSLNSGHNWHFTASWMGEPPGLVGDQVDMNARYRRLYYHEAPTDNTRQFMLGYAVAASACVPGLFPPLPLNGLYPGRSIELVDGGVHDNQGVAGLLDEGCNLILCSDASGQMNDQPAPAANLFGVLSRSKSILQDRVRETQLDDLAMRVKSRALHGMLYVHLKQDLAMAPLSWIDCKDPAPEAPLSAQTCYGVDREIQQRLAGMRTDLDTFTEAEAYALMASGYLATAHQLEVLDRDYQQLHPGQHWCGFHAQAARADQAPGGSRWPFAPLFDIIGKPPSSSDLRRHDLARQLAVSRELFGKVWRLHRPLQAIAGLAALGGLAALAYLWGRYADSLWILALKVEFGSTSIAVALLALLVLFGFPLFKVARFNKAGESLLVKLLAATVGVVAGNLHLWLFEGIYQRRGSLARLLRLGAPPMPRPVTEWIPADLSAMDARLPDPPLAKGKSGRR